MNSDWLDMSAFPDTDPDTVAPPGHLLDLQLLLQSVPAGGGVIPGDWQLMLSLAVSPPDLVESSADGFDDWHEAAGDDAGAGHGDPDPPPLHDADADLADGPDHDDGPFHHNDHDDFGTDQGIGGPDDFFDDIHDR